MQVSGDMQRIFNDKSLTMNQKMVYFFAFGNMPALPQGDNTDRQFLELGNTIKQMIHNGSLTIKGFDKDFDIITE